MTSTLVGSWRIESPEAFSDGRKGICSSTSSDSVFSEESGAKTGEGPWLSISLFRLGGSTPIASEGSMVPLPMLFPVRSEPAIASSASFSSIACLSFRALSFLNCFLSSLRLLVASSLVSPSASPCLIFSLSSQAGSLRLKLPLPKKPCSHSVRAVFSSVTWIERVSAEK